MRHFLPTLQDESGRIYQAEELPIHGSMGTRAFRVYKPDGSDTYDVNLDSYGVLQCSCPDYQCRKKGTDQLCKHGDSLVSAGLMPKPEPTRRY
jgi:hypothetical protein